MLTERMAQTKSFTSANMQTFIFKGFQGSSSRVVLEIPTHLMKSQHSVYQIYSAAAQRNKGVACGTAG